MTNLPITDEILSARGHCYDSCFQNDLLEITLHSVIGLGSKDVEKMKIFNGDSLIYYENHINHQNKSFKLIKPTKLQVNFQPFFFADKYFRLCQQSALSNSKKPVGIKNIAIQPVKRLSIIFQTTVQCRLSVFRNPTLMTQ